MTPTADHDFIPVENSINLGPTDDEDIWQITFKDEQSGENVRLLLPLQQLSEMDGEFTGYIPG